MTMQPRLRRAAWRDELSQAATVPDVIDLVQRVLRARSAHSSALASSWEPREIRSREDIEHWDRRVRSHPPGRSSVRSLAALGELMRFALDRMNELGPRRRP
jgi:hypothetical protein